MQGIPGSNTPGSRGPLTAREQILMLLSDGIAKSTRYIVNNVDVSRERVIQILKTLYMEGIVDTFLQEEDLWNGGKLKVRYWRLKNVRQD